MFCTETGMLRWARYPPGACSRRLKMSRQPSSCSGRSIRNTSSKSHPGLKKSADGTIAGVSWMAHVPRCAGEVRGEIRMSLAPSCRAATRPLSVFVSPGPVVQKTATGRPPAMPPSIAANTAPCSWLKHTWFSPSIRARQTRAIPPPGTPKAHSTPRCERPRARLLERSLSTAATPPIDEETAAGSMREVGVTAGLRRRSRPGRPRCRRRS
jgi:hypothetical protein